MLSGKCRDCGYVRENLQYCVDYFCLECREDFRVTTEELNNEVLEVWAKENPELVQDWSEERNQIWRMEREEVVDLLEGACIQCYDNEDDDCLKTALLENVKDGTITL